MRPTLSAGNPRRAAPVVMSEDNRIIPDEIEDGGFSKGDSPQGGALKRGGGLFRKRRKKTDAEAEEHFGDLTDEEKEARIQEAIIKGEMLGVQKRRHAKRFFLRTRKPKPEGRIAQFPKRFGRIIDGYVFMEALSMWLLGFFGFLGFLIVNQLFLEGEHILNPQIPTHAVLRLIFFNIPQHITWSLPIAIVFATLMSMGRLAKDNELTAMFTNGISLYRLFLPFFFLAIANCVALYFVNEYLVTPGAAQQEKLKQRYPLLRQEGEVDAQDPTIVKLPDGRYLSAKKFNKFSGSVEDIILDNLTSAAEGETRYVWTSRKGTIQGAVLSLTIARKYNLGEDGQVQTMESLPSANIDLGLELHQIYSDIRTPAQLTREELKRQQAIKKELGTSADRDLTDLWLKYSAPFAPLAFALVAMPLSLRAPRDERLLGLIFTFLLVFFYYVLYFTAKIMGYNGVIPPWLAAWLMNIVFFGLSVLIFATSRK